MKKLEIRCALTNKVGKPAKSHLLPKALTNLHKAQGPRIEAGYSGQKERRHDSWYDINLCTEDGESVLAKIDDFGIEELREHHLIWDSWAINQELSSVTKNEVFLDAEEDGARIVKFSDLDKIKVFFLSLLWRCAASKRPEMKDVVLSTDEIEKLRKIVNGEKFELEKLFPITLIQLSTKGPIHNRTPYTEIASFGIRKIRQARIYFDGLIARIGIDINDDSLSSLNGNEKKSLILCKNYENSLQNEHIQALVLAQTSATFLFIKNEFSRAIELMPAPAKNLIVFGSP